MELRLKEEMEAKQGDIVIIETLGEVTPYIITRIAVNGLNLINLSEGNKRFTESYPTIRGLLLAVEDTKGTIIRIIPNKKIRLEEI